MLSKDELLQMSQIDILKASAESLIDINSISIDASLSIEQKFSDYLAKIKNPYGYLCNGVKVKISFSDTQKTLEKALIRYFSDL